MTPVNIAIGEAQGQLIKLVIRSSLYKYQIFMNCKNLILAGFGSGNAHFNQYLTLISETFLLLNTEKNHEIVVSSEEQFTKLVLSHPQNLGVCLAGSGVLQCSKLNQIKGIRAAVVHNKYIAEMCRKHNNANVMILSTDCIGEKLAASIIKDYLLSGFDNEERNMLRIGKLKQLEEKYQGKVLQKA